MRMRRAAGRTVVALAASLLLVGGVVSAERKFETPIGRIVLDTDPAWKDLRPVPGGLNGIAFEMGSGARAMQFVLATVEEAGQNVDAPTVRKLTEELRRAESNGHITVSELKSFAGSRLTGYYFEATGVPGTRLAPGEYRRMIEGFIYTNSFPLAFTIAWNEEGAAAAARAFDAVKRLEIQGR